MRDIDSDALSAVQRQLGISGVGSGVAVLEDDELRQVLDVGPALRRGRADVANGGWFWGVLDNEHSGSGDLISFINPYEADGFELTSFPALVDQSRFDLWICGAFCEITSGVASSLNSAQFLLGAPLRSLAFGKDDSGAAVVPSGGGFLLNEWDVALSIITGGVNPIIQNANVAASYQRSWRMPRGANLVFQTDATAAVTIRLSIIMGLFPIGLGQDVAY